MYNEEEKEQIANEVYNWLQVHNCSCGEVAEQDDDCLIDAIDLISTLADIKNVTKDNKTPATVFLGGTCSDSTWRQELIPMLKIPYFNPVVPNWDEECIKKEEAAKLYCLLHLYVITPKIRGVYSIAEAVTSTHLSNVVTVFCILPKDEEFTPSGHTVKVFTENEMKSLDATANLIADSGGIIAHSLEEVAEILNKFKE